MNAFFAYRTDAGICVTSVYIDLIDLFNGGNREQRGYIKLGLVDQYDLLFAAL